MQCTTHSRGSSNSGLRSIRKRFCHPEFLRGDTPRASIASWLPWRSTSPKSWSGPRNNPHSPDERSAAGNADGGLLAMRNRPPPVCCRVGLVPERHRPPRGRVRPIPADRMLSERSAGLARWRTVLRQGALGPGIRGVSVSSVRRLWQAARVGTTPRAMLAGRPEAPPALHEAAPVSMGNLSYNRCRPGNPEGARC